MDALNEAQGPKHSTQPLVVVESLSLTTDEVGPDDKTQDMSGNGESGGTSVPSPAVSSSSSTSSATQQNNDIEETRKEGSINEDSKSRKRKRGKQEAANALLEKMVKLQENSDKMMYMLEERRAKMEERQMELDVQLRREEWEFQLQMVQMMSQQSVPRQFPPPPSHYGLHSPFSYGSVEYDPDVPRTDCDPDATPECMNMQVHVVIIL